MTSQLATGHRTHTLGDLSDAWAGDPVTLCGWAPRARAETDDDPWLELRDRFGRARIRIDVSPAVQTASRQVQPGDVIRVQGTITRIPEELDALIEVTAAELEVLSPSAPLPLNPYDDPDGAGLSRTDRLRLRPLELRRPALLERLEIRSALTLALRKHLAGQGFLEVDTPILGPWTPDASSAFYAPTAAGEVFGLTQTPQAWKQLLMLGGVDRYFQLARCFRREDRLTTERQLEFTTLDLELSFVTEDDLFQVVKALIDVVFTGALGEAPATPITKLSYDAALLRYGTDRPDLRFGLEIEDVTELVAGSTAPLFQPALAASRDPGGAVRVLVIPAAKAVDLSDEQLEALVLLSPVPDLVRLSWARVASSTKLQGPGAASLEARFQAMLLPRLDAQPGDALLFFTSANRHAAAAVAGEMRRDLGRRLELIDPARHRLVWVHSYPFWGYRLDGDCFVPVRHPFTRPQDADLKHLEGVGPLRPSIPAASLGPDNFPKGTAFDRQMIPVGPSDRSDWLRIRTGGYELSLDGIELATGSLRNHDPAVQEKIFAMFGFELEEVRSRHGFLLDALRYGAPPHGGIAIGLDRLLAILLEVDDIGEVVAFPKSARGRCEATGASNRVDPEAMMALLNR